MRKTFILNYPYQGYRPEVKEQIAEMVINGSGIRDTGRVLKISPNTVIKELKKEEYIEVINYALLEQLDIETLDVDLYEVQEAEMDEMWSFVGYKKNKDGYGTLSTIGLVGS